MIHELKIIPQYFEAVVKGIKTFELRKNDRDYKVGKMKILKRQLKCVVVANSTNKREMV